jgi:sulfur-oxidizing protein SoxZ
MAEQMKIRALLQGDVAEVKVLMNHPMETGQRKDPKTGQAIPAHFIQTVTATLNGRSVMEAHWSQSISKNPFLGFKVKGAKAGDRIGVSWVDNRGDRNAAEATVSG